MKSLNIYLLIFLFVPFCALAQSYNIKEFGAVADVKTINTQAIQSAIDKCTAGGGGEVIVPAGIFYSGTIILKSNVYLHLMPGAVLQGSYNPADYPEHDILSHKKFGTITHDGQWVKYMKALIIADNAQNVGIIGEGAVKGAGEGEAFQLGLNKDGKPINIFFIGCSNVRLKDIHVLNAAQVTISISKCERVFIDGLYVNSQVNWNCDGMDVDSRNVVISNCIIESEDGWDKSDKTNTYKTLGWIPVGRMCNSMTLEYAYNDFCASELAKDLGTKADYKKYLDRSGKWIALWNPKAESDGFKGFIDSKNPDGSFVGIDLKKYPGSWKDHFYEGTSWTYSWFAPHQFPKIVELCGGKDMFVKKLQHGFEKNLIDYGNEPAFLAVHGFHYGDRSDLASYYTRKLMKERFDENGYSGNDDSGAMSTWYMFSSMGFFPNAGQDIYYLIGSSFKKVTMTLANKKTVTISAPNASMTNIYVKSVTINGQKWNQPWFHHKDIQNGAKIVFDMTDKPVLIKN